MSSVANAPPCSASSASRPTSGQPSPISAPGTVEILQGMRSDEWSAVRGALDSLPWFPLYCRRGPGGELGREYRTSHHLGLADLVVAATADVHHVELVTSNVRRFPMLLGLRAPN